MKIGLLINPLAGIGGPVGLKGSDGEAVVREALSLGARRRAGQRALTALRAIGDEPVDWHCASGPMGQDCLREIGQSCRVVYRVSGETGAEDTLKTVDAMCRRDIDLLVFAGGDGTARDVLDGLRRNHREMTLPVVGIPAGCKIHSAVYAVTPEKAGESIRRLLAEGGVNQREAAVMDLDEVAFRHGQVKSRCYGYLTIPADDPCMQASKQGGIEDEAGSREEIAAEVVDNLDADTLYIIGSGSTTAAIMETMGLDGTLLGVDVVLNRQLVASDVDERTLLALLERHQPKPVRMIVTVIGGQGHVFGRGNQQLSADVIRRVGRHNVILVASRKKLGTLRQGRLIVDTGDSELDKRFDGLVSVITGYQQKTLMKIGFSGEGSRRRES